MNTFQLIRRFMPYFKKYTPILIFDLFCATLTTVCELVFPQIVRFITNTAMYEPAALTMEVVTKIGILYIALRVIDVAANYYMSNTGHVMGARIETDMRSAIFDHLQKLSFSYYSDAKIGQIMARITSDLFDVTEFAHHCPEEFFIAAIKFIVSFCVLSSVNLTLTVIIFASLPLMFVVTKIFNKRMKNAFKMQRNQTGEINARVEDSLLGVRVVKSFTAEDTEKKKFEEGNAKFLELKKLTYKYMASFNASTRFIDGLMYVTVLIIGASFMIKGAITPADLVAYLLYVSTLLTTIRKIIDFSEQFQRGMTGIERFIEIMDEPVEISDAPDAIDLGEVKGDICFENVDFCYSDDNTRVLSGIDMKIKAGQSVAVVGPSGGGKSTLCSLIPRFYDVTGGRVTVDGIDVRAVKLKSLRQKIGVVQQEVYLFSGTIFENIAYAKPGASLDEVIEAAKKAGAHEFISKLDKGYDTYVGERGVKLSGGQKQRISIARVFLKNPPILILDEATSALDNESERIVQKSLESLAKGRTVLTIAHRLTTIRNADEIIVLTENGIAERGNHDELMRANGIYAEFYGLYTV